jgi:hypothetical protein
MAGISCAGELTGSIVSLEQQPRGGDFRAASMKRFRFVLSSRDNLKAIHPDDYYSAYRLAATYLAYPDGVPE